MNYAHFIKYNVYKGHLIDEKKHLNNDFLIQLIDRHRIRQMLKLMHTINFWLHLEVIYMNIFRLCYEIKTIKQNDVIYINFIILKLKICKQRLSYIVFTST